MHPKTSYPSTPSPYIPAPRHPDTLHPSTHALQHPATRSHASCTHAPDPHTLLRCTPCTPSPYIPASQHPIHPGTPYPSIPAPVPSTSPPLTPPIPAPHSIAQHPHPCLEEHREPWAGCSAAERRWEESQIPDILSYYYFTTQKSNSCPQGYCVNGRCWADNPLLRHYPPHWIALPPSSRAGTM